MNSLLYNEETDAQKLTFNRIALCMVYTVGIKILEINSSGVSHSVLKFSKC